MPFSLQEEHEHDFLPLQAILSASSTVVSTVTFVNDGDDVPSPNLQPATVQAKVTS
jgi:hypothetical protein